jgi:hypothetical protein
MRDAVSREAVGQDARRSATAESKIAFSGALPIGVAPKNIPQSAPSRTTMKLTWSPESGRLGFVTLTSVSISHLPGHVAGVAQPILRTGGTEQDRGRKGEVPAVLPAFRVDTTNAMTTITTRASTATISPLLEWGRVGEMEITVAGHSGWLWSAATRSRRPSSGSDPGDRPGRDTTRAGASVSPASGTRWSGRARRPGGHRPRPSQRRRPVPPPAAREVSNHAVFGSKVGGPSTVG